MMQYSPATTEELLVGYQSFQESAGSLLRHQSGHKTNPNCLGQYICYGNTFPLSLMSLAVATPQGFWTKVKQKYISSRWKVQSTGREQSTTSSYTSLFTPSLRFELLV